MIADGDMAGRALCLALSYLLPEYRTLLRNVALDSATRRPAQVVSNRKAGRKNRGGRKKGKVADDVRA